MGQIPTLQGFPVSAELAASGTWESPASSRVQVAERGVRVEGWRKGRGGGPRSAEGDALLCHRGEAEPDLGVASRGLGPNALKWGKSSWGSPASQGAKCF